ncbi:MAG TPA: PAS domain-containing protein [Rhizomicrobium sp.]|nr:PAS domain-containing protein [Rhizomicrobium sp.]
MPDKAPDSSTSPAMAAAEPPHRRQQIALEDISNPMIRQGLDLWLCQRGERLFPAREDMTPRHMKSLLRNAVLIRVRDCGEEFEVRIIGDSIVQAQGANFRGLTTRDIDARLAGYGTTLRRIYQEACATKAPLALRGWFQRAADKRSFFHESLVLPLGKDDGAVDHLLTLAVYANEQGG